MTDPTGLSFLSYRRSRADEAELLIGAQHDRGVPTWQDITNLAHEATEDELRRVLRDPGTASVLLWVTPDVEDSAVIIGIEAPEMKARKKADDGFFIVPVAAGGADYEAAAAIVSKRLGLDDFGSWNFEKTAEDRISPEEAGRIAKVVLRERVRAWDGAAPNAEPLGLGVWTWHRPPDDAREALRLDWSRHFDGRFSKAGAWDTSLLPALRDVVSAISGQCPGRPIVARGQLSLTAALALGVAFMEPCGLQLIWTQNPPAGAAAQEWSLAAQPEDSGVEARLVSRDAGAEDLLVAVNLRAPSEHAIKRGLEDGTIPPHRGAVVVGADDADVHLANAGQALDAVNKTVAGIKEARRRWPTTGEIHLFVAAPVGYAVMLGQKLNVLGPVQTYEHDPTDGVGRYVPSVLLTPGR